MDRYHHQNLQHHFSTITTEDLQYHGHWTPPGYFSLPPFVFNFDNQHHHHLHKIAWFILHSSTSNRYMQYVHRDFFYYKIILSFQWIYLLLLRSDQVISLDER